MYIDASFMRQHCLEAGILTHTWDLGFEICDNASVTAIPNPTATDHGEDITWSDEVGNVIYVY